jgi:drug/metabolite transporter (DMT)-like permease
VAEGTADRDTSRVVIASATTGVLVGGAIVASRALLPDVGPVGVAVLRYVTAAIVLGTAVVVWRRNIIVDAFIPIALLGIAQFAVLVVLMNWALLYITSGEASVLFATMPLMTLTLGRNATKTTLLELAGLVATIAGVALCVGASALERTPTLETFSGAGAAVLSALIGAMCSLKYRRYVGEYGVMTVGTLQTFAAAAFLSILALADGSIRAIPILSPGGWAIAAFLGAATVIGYSTFLWALGRARATHVVAFLALGPVTAAIAGSLFLREPVAPGLVFGICLLTGGLIIVSRKPDASGPQVTAPRAAIKKSGAGPCATRTGFRSHRRQARRQAPSPTAGRRRLWRSLYRAPLFDETDRLKRQDEAETHPRECIRSQQYPHIGCEMHTARTE